MGSVRSFRMGLIALCAATAAVASAEIVIDLLPVADVDNLGDPQSQGTFGAVDHDYAIGKFEVTNGQYIAFLNPVARSDPHGLYASGMNDTYGGIARDGIAGG